jgi:outer membrane protein OmpA-like peptidoglycan-associated protein
VSKGISIQDPSLQLSDDSVQVHLNLFGKNLKIGARESLTVDFRIESEDKGINLPSVIFTGKQRLAYDRRNHLLSGQTPPAVYHTYKGIREKDIYSLAYNYNVPYARWMKDAHLKVSQRMDDCCHIVLLDEKVLSLLSDIPETNIQVAPPVYFPPEVQPVEPAKPDITYPNLPEPSNEPKPNDNHEPAYTWQREVIHIEYPVNQYDIQPHFDNNWRELQKIDYLFSDNKPMGKIMVTAYASPEGPYMENELLAKRRAEGLKKYLINQYKIPFQQIYTNCIAEDWDGLRSLVLKNVISHKNEVLNIIDHVGIFQGRERQLMDLDKGNVWRQMKPLFDGLRRIEIVVENVSARDKTSDIQSVSRENYAFDYQTVSLNDQRKGMYQYDSQQPYTPSNRMDYRDKKDNGRIVQQRELVYIQYPVGRYDIQPQYDNNWRELQKVVYLFNGNFQTCKIRLTAYSSPEDDSYNGNEQLIKNRVETFKNYLVSQYGISSQQIGTDYVAEDWDGLKALLIRSDVPRKDDVLAIIDHVGISEGRKHLLMNLDKGAVWQQMKPLRDNLCRIEIVVESDWTENETSQMAINGNLEWR